MQPTVTQLLPDVTAVCVCVAAAGFDLRTRRIPNRLTYTAWSLGVLEHALLALGAGSSVPAAIAGAILGALVCVSIFGTLAALGSMGLGDVKLMAAVGALLRLPLAFWAALYVLAAGGAVAIGYALARGRLLVSLRNIVRGRIRLSELQTPERNAQEMPYATAILVGTLWAVLGRYLPALQFP